MGGIGSGRYGGGATVEDSLVLDLGRLIRQGIFRPGCTWGGSIVWSEVYSGRETARIGYEAHLGHERGYARLRYTTTSWSGERREYDYRVEMTTTPQPFGGRRWWWICPRSGRRVAKLYKPPGGGYFASRETYRLSYRCQRQSPYNRAINRAFKLRRRLGSTDGIGEPIDKPKGMRWRTFDRAMDRVEAAERIVDGHLWLLVRRFGT